jgi:alpha-1,2-mannosyltransferase
MNTRRSPGGAGWAPTIAWRLVQLLTLAAFIRATWGLLDHTPYRIDIDVYRMGGQAWLDGKPLYTGNVMFHTLGGLDLPFTYPPLAAIVFTPFTLLSLDAASVTITVITLVLLVVSTTLVLSGLDVWPRTRVGAEPAWLRRGWLAAAIVAFALVYLEPIHSNFDFGQINVVLMTLVIADCVPRRTPWPRGILLGLAIALKLTPAVFLLFFLLRRDTRTLVTAAVSVVVATLLGFALAWQDSWEYWTHTVAHTDRIGSASLNTNQNIAATLARTALGDGGRFALWVLAGVLVLAVTVWAARRALRAGEPMLALICVAMFGLLVSPVSWSHHWVWALPAVMVCAVVAFRHRHVLLGAVTAGGVALMMWEPLTLMPKHHETAAPLWRQLVGSSYVWWALIVIVVAGTVSARVPDDSAATTGPDRVPAAS